MLEEKKALGATPQIRGEVLEKLKQRLNSKAGFSSDAAIVTWLQQECVVAARMWVNDGLRNGAPICAPHAASQTQSPPTAALEAVPWSKRDF